MYILPDGQLGKGTRFRLLWLVVVMMMVIGGRNHAAV
jgi:hypothetical protein